MNKEYIERDYLVKEAEATLMFRKQFYMDNKYIQDAADTVEWLKYYAPAADVEEVVRCKNCSIGFEVETDHPLHPVRKYIYCPDRNEEVEPDGFCKWSKRRE